MTRNNFFFANTEPEQRFSLTNKKWKKYSKRQKLYQSILGGERKGHILGTDVFGAGPTDVREDLRLPSKITEPGGKRKREVSRVREKMC